jgi:RNA recognition motif-containing protein
MTPMVKLFVGGFPLDLDDMELELVKLFSWHGDVSTIKIVRDKKTRVCKGYAFLEMTSRTGAEDAVIALDGTIFKERVLSVKIREDKPVVAPRGGYSNSGSTNRFTSRSSSASNSNTNSNFNSNTNNSSSAGEQRPKRPRKQI